jgi:hypothetical protein
VLTADRWRVREDVRLEEERLNPSRAERRNSSKLRNEVRRANEQGRRGVIIAASRNQCNRASVIRAIPISVDARV